MNIKQFFLYLLLVLLVFSSCKDKEKSTPADQKTPETELQINKLIEEQPDNADLYINRAGIHLANGNEDAAIQDLNKVQQLNPNDIPSAHKLADILFDSEQYDKAIATLAKTIELNPKSTMSKLKLSEYYLLLQKHTQSESLLKDMLVAEPQNPEIHYMLGLLYESQAKVDLAIDAFQSATENNPDLVEAWIKLGQLHENKDYNLSMKYFENAISVAPEKPEPYHSKAFLLQNNGHIREAIEIYKQINLKHPTYIPSFLNTGILYMKIDSLPQAKEHFNVIIQQYPSNPVGYHYLAQAELKGGNKSKALQLANDALQLNPDYTVAITFIESINAQ